MQLKKWAQDLNRCFAEEAPWLTNKSVRRCSSSGIGMSKPKPGGGTALGGGADDSRGALRPRGTPWAGTGRPAALGRGQAGLTDPGCLCGQCSGLAPRQTPARNKKSRSLENLSRTFMVFYS